MQLVEIHPGKISQLRQSVLSEQVDCDKTVTSVYVWNFTMHVWSLTIYHKCFKKEQVVLWICHQVLYYIRDCEIHATLELCVHLLWLCWAHYQWMSESPIHPLKKLWYVCSYYKSYDTICMKTVVWFFSSFNAGNWVSNFRWMGELIIMSKWTRIAMLLFHVSRSSNSNLVQSKNKMCVFEKTSHLCLCHLGRHCSQVVLAACRYIRVSGEGSSGSWSGFTIILTTEGLCNCLVTLFMVRSIHCAGGGSTPPQLVPALNNLPICFWPGGGWRFLRWLFRDITCHGFHYCDNAVLRAPPWAVYGYCRCRSGGGLIVWGWGRHLYCMYVRSWTHRSRLYPMILLFWKWKYTLQVINLTFI